MSVNDVLDPSRRNRIYATFKNDAETPMSSCAGDAVESTIPFYNSDQWVQVEGSSERAPADSLGRSHTGTVEPGSASSVLNPANIEDVVEQNMNAAHDTFAGVTVRSKLTIGMILIAAVVMYESGRIFF